MTRRWTLPPRLLLALLAVGALVAFLLAFASPLEPIVLNAALVAHVTGMLAGYGAAVMMILMSRSPAIEHGVGSDRLARWHSRMGPVVIGLAVVHALAALESWAGVRGVGLITATREVLGWPGLFSAALGLVLLVVVGLGSLRWVRRQMPYEHWHLFHLLTYVAVALGFTHQLAGPNLVGSRAAQIGWSLLYAYAFAMVVRYRLLQPLHQLWRHRLRSSRSSASRATWSAS